MQAHSARLILIYLRLKIEHAIHTAVLIYKSKYIHSFVNFTFVGDLNALINIALSKSQKLADFKWVMPGWWVEHIPVEWNAGRRKNE